MRVLDAYPAIQLNPRSWCQQRHISVFFFPAEQVSRKTYGWTPSRYATFRVCF